MTSLLRAAALVVSGDTGPLHLAAALGTPVVGLYGPSDPARNGPWSPADEVVSAFADCGCAVRRAAGGRAVPMVRRCRAGTPCLDELTAERGLRRRGSAPGTHRACLIWTPIRFSAFLFRVARRRVILGFLVAVVAFAYARPSWRSMAAGVPVALVGEGLRIWAAGHLVKGP